MIKIKYRNTLIKQTNNIKFLGRGISNSLTLTNHYGRVIGEASGNSNAFKAGNGLAGGLDQNRALTFYRAIIRSRIE